MAEGDDSQGVEAEGDSPLSRPDAVSAMVTARATGERVEDISRRTESSQLFANSDGTWTSETASGPEFVRDADGEWQDVDTSLVERDGVLVPKAVPSGLELSAGGDRVFAAMAEVGQGVAWRWRTLLPEPVVDGSTATYPEVVEGGDLVVTATPTGFTHSVVLHEQPQGPVDLTIKVATGDGELVEGARGQLNITNAAGTKTLLTAPAPVMWDSTGSEDGELGDGATLVDTEVGETAGGTPTLTLSPDEEFLSDPSTVYPVTIDPSFTSYASGDAWVSNVTTASQQASSELRVGTPDGGATKNRTYLRFNSVLAYNGVPNAANIISASLVLRNFSSSTCTNSPITVSRITGQWTLSSLTWGSQPAVSTSDSASFSPNYGYSSACPAADATWNVTAAVRAWQAGATNEGFRIKADDETVNKSYRRYRSLEGATGSAAPKLSVTYNTLPGVATEPTMLPTTSYTPPGEPTKYLTNSRTPTFTARAPDADWDTVGLTMYVYHANHPEWGPYTSCQAPPVPQWTDTSCSSTSPLPDGAYWVRAKAGDYYGWSGGGTLESESGWGPFLRFVVDTTAPLAPLVTANRARLGAWTNTRPESNTFTFQSGAADAASFQYQQDFGTIRTLAATNGNATLNWNPAGGEHVLSVRTVDQAGNVSPWKYFSWGVGGVAVETRGKIPTSTDTFPLSMSGPPGATGARLEWRYAAETAWNPLTKARKSDGSAWTGAVTAGAVGSEVTDLVWAATDEIVPDAATAGDKVQAPALLETRACFTYAGTSDVCSPPAMMQLVMSAFGRNFPVTGAGPGRVALSTGEFAHDATDVTVSGGGGGSLSVSRSYGSYTGAPVLPSRRVFGPGWSGSLDGTEAGFAGMQLTDNTQVDGTLVLSTPTVETLTFAPNGGWNLRTGNAITEGEWIGVDELTPSLGLKAAVTGNGADTKFVVTDPAGVVTTFKVTTAPTATTAAVFAADSVIEPGAGKTTYDRDAQGRITRILGALPTGMTAANCTAGSWAAGCRALEIDYATTTTATTGTPGDMAGQVKQIRLRVFDAAKPAGETKTMAAYAYDSSKRLVAVTDGLTGLTTGYGYNGDGRLATITPPGLTPFQMEYAGTFDRLARVKRDRPAASGGGTATLATVLYGLRPDLLTSGLPDLRPQATNALGQDTAPMYGAAVFGADKPVSTLDPTQVAAADWPYADLWYTDFRSRTVNTASYGAGEWQLTSTSYDVLGNPVRQLGPGDVAAIRSGALNAQDAGTKIVYNTATNGPANTPANTVVTDTYGPARLVRNAAGTAAMLRPHTRTTYDEGSPNEGVNPATDRGWALPTTVTTGAVQASTLTASGDPVTIVKTAYGDTAGWTLGLPTASTTVMGGSLANIVTRTGYDAAGRVIEQRQPNSNGTDAGTRRTVYYTKAANTEFPACGGKPDWEGLICRIYYAGSPSIGPALPVSTVTGYDQFLLQPATTTEISGAVTRTTHTTYDTAGREKKTWTTLAGATTDPAPGSEREYDADTGLPTKQWATDTTGARTSEYIDTGYDSWGRTTTYKPYGDSATTTTYDSAGRVATVADPKGTTTYTYDGEDAAGEAERRGLATRLSVTAPTGAVEFSGAYDANGKLTLEALPGGIKRRNTYDIAGQQTGLSYSGTVTRTGPDGTTTDPDAPWLAWSLTRDIAGRIIGEATPDAAAPTGGLSDGTAAAYSRGYTYDRAGRLTKVVDRTAPGGQAQYDAGNSLLDTTCQTREYGYDANGNRAHLARYEANADGSCSTAGDSINMWSYDSADRTTGGYGYKADGSVYSYSGASSGGYSYDNLGRVTTIPAVETPTGSSAGKITLGYYDTDAARTITQNGITSTYTLDAAGRRSVETTGPTGGAATTTATSHFTDGSDNPTWVEKVSGGTTTTTRYLDALDGDLGAALTASTLALAVANPHGDIVTTVPVPATGAATGIDSWNTYDEYGNTTTGVIGTAPFKTATGIGYGWVGANQRAAHASGLILMGVRIYNSATGIFTSVDPVYGGNSTTYAYPQDPVGSYDLTGKFECGWCSKAVGYAKDKARDYVAGTISASVNGYYLARSTTTFAVRSFAQARVDARFIARVLYDDVHRWGRWYSPRHRRPLY